MNRAGRKAVFILVLVAGAVLAAALPAHAWGPATHLELARQLLAAKELLPLPVASLLAAFPYDFLYGNVAADMIIGKKFVDPLRHCHSWPVAFELFAKAATPARQAFVYGYLAHLAADVVAHNSYVPTQMVRHYRHKGAPHLYWEMRFELTVPQKLWPYAHLISRRVRWDNDPLMMKNLTPTIFSFPVNRRLFNTMLLLNRTRRWQQLLGRLEHVSRYGLPAGEVAAYKQRCLANMREILAAFDAAALLASDPRGEENLALARELARRFRGRGRPAAAELRAKEERFRP
ncbi:MAG: zinc dependent phospholipase C family protein [Deltaproteobacteria bacterium]|nr:zinc dependent phospholipase C family protein [Deltaproteobacteria bacterium]